MSVFFKHLEGTFYWDYGQAILNGEIQDQEETITEEAIKHFDNNHWDETRYWSGTNC